MKKFRLSVLVIMFCFSCILFTACSGKSSDAGKSSSVSGGQKEKYIENNEIIDGILQKDKLFSSPSYAASFVLGRSINGKELWKTKEGFSLNDLETKEME